MAVMGSLSRGLAKAGVLLDANRLAAEFEGLADPLLGGKRTVIDGPFAETKELHGRLHADSGSLARRSHGVGAALSGAVRRHADGEIEVRQLFELDDFEPGPDVERFRELDAARAKWQ